MFIKLRQDIEKPTIGLKLKVKPTLNLSIRQSSKPKPPCIPFEIQGDGYRIYVDETNYYIEIGEQTIFSSTFDKMMDALCEFYLKKNIIEGVDLVTAIKQTRLELDVVVKEFTTKLDAMNR